MHKYGFSFDVKDLVASAPSFNFPNWSANKCVASLAREPSIRIVDAATFIRLHGATPLTRIPGFCPTRTLDSLATNRGVKWGSRFP